MPIVETKVAVLQAEANLVALFATPRLEYLPAVIPQPVAAPPPLEEVLGDPLEPVDETDVPDIAQQRLIYHWLLNGPPDWRHLIVAEAPPLSPDDPVVVPLQQRDHRSDGVRRMIVYRE